MKTIQINNTDYEIPTSWDDVTLSTQIKYGDIKEEDEQLKLLKTICLYSSIEDIKIIKEAPIRIVKRIVKMLEFLTMEIPADPILIFEYKGKDYSIIENMEKEEFQDWVSIHTIIDANEENKWKSIPYIIAILTKEKSLDDTDIDAMAKHFEDLPVPIANKISTFFLLNKMLYEKNGKLFLMEKNLALKSLDEIESTLLKQGGGEFVIKSLIGELKSYIQSLDNH